MKKKAQEQSENMKLATKDFTDHPLLYIALVLSALLSMFAGIAIGLGVRVDAGTVRQKATCRISLPLFCTAHPSPFSLSLVLRIG